MCTITWWVSGAGSSAIAYPRTTVVVYYLDDDAASKQFSAVVSELQRVWLNNIELIPLVTDPLQNRADTGPSDPAHYWSGLIPQVVVFNSEGKLVFDEQGAVSVDAINAAVSQATGIPLPEGGHHQHHRELQRTQFRGGEPLMGRIESDSMGAIEVPEQHYWGAQTQRSIEYFPFGQAMPLAVLHAF